MDKYVTGAVIRRLREERHMTQEELAEKLFVSSKAVSKWETGKGLPDVTLLEPLAAALGISTIELFAGEDVTNKNKSSNMLRTKFYVCPVCGNIIHSSGEAVVSCCGITLPPLEAEVPDDGHGINVEADGYELYVTMDHVMTKDHYISFIAALSDQGVQLVKLYPEGMAEARFSGSRVKRVLAYCNRHGLFEVKVSRKRSSSTPRQ